MSSNSSSHTRSNTHLMVPMFIFAVLLSIAAIRGPAIISSTGIGSAVIVVAPLILATYALTVIVMAGRAGVDLSIGPLLGFINVGLIQLLEVGVIESPIWFFLYAIGVGIAYQLVMGLIIVYVRVQPIIVSLSGYLALVGLNLIILPRPGGVAPDWMLDWGSGTEIWSPVLVILIIATAGWYVLANTAFFGHLRLMGSDERAAYTSGVKINIVRLGAHVIAGVYAGLAAICFTSLISSGDPTQGTTYTLLAVTALVLGGANLAGGRGGAFGSMLGALNIYLITYLLGTFNFGRFQSFVTDLSYGTVLVLSLLISLALPQIQQLVRHLSPAVFISVLAAVVGGVILHATMDLGPGTVAAVDSLLLPTESLEPEAAETPTAGALGTVILLVILGIAGLIYLLSILVRYPRAPMISLVLLIAIAALGLVFNGYWTLDATQSTVHSAGRDFAASLQYLALESTEFAASEYESPVAGGAYAILLALGITGIASLIIGLNLPHTSLPSISAPVVLSGLVLLVLLVLAIVSTKYGSVATLFGTEILVVALVATILFVLTFSPLQSRLPNISNVYFGALGLLALGFVYFAATGSQGPADVVRNYAPPVFVESTVRPAPVLYAVPTRQNTLLMEEMSLSQWAYSILVIVLLQFSVWKAMRHGYLLEQFWPHLKVVIPSIIVWGTFFYSAGVSLWNVAVVIVVAAVTAPFVWRAFGSFWNGRMSEARRR